MNYWSMNHNSDKFIKHIEKAVQVADAKFLKDVGYQLYWIFDHSSCHTTYAYDSLNTSKMNAKRGGCQHQCMDLVWYF